MRNKSEQMSLFDTYKGVAASMEEDKPKLFRLLDEHIDWDTLVPARFYMAFYQNTGRPRKYPLVAFLKSLVLQKIFCYVNDSVLLVTLRHSREMRKFCGFSKVPDAAKLTRFKQDFLPYIMEVFERLVELTEPICREMDAELAGSLIYDTTGIESYVAENNPKFFSSKLRQAKLMAKTNPNTETISLYSPINTIAPGRYEIIIRLSEMAATEKPAMSRQRRRMSTLEHKIPATVDQRAFASGIRTPQHIYHSGTFGIETANHGVGETLPAVPRMRGGRRRTYRKHRIEKQHALIGPSVEITGRWPRSTELIFYLLEYVHQRRWERHSVRHGET